MREMARLSRTVVFPLALAWACLAAPTVDAQLPPAIQVDRLLVQADRQIGDGDGAGALATFDRIVAIARENGLEIPAAFWFKDAQVAQEAGMPARAVESVTRYLTVVGQGGEAYREALVLLDAAEAAKERPRPGSRFRDCEDCPEMVVLPDGDPAMGRYEVTVGEYRAFASATGRGAGDCRSGDSWRDPGFPQTDRHPVTCVNWGDAQAYVSWLSRRTGAAYRLPTEAEWERAAAGSQPGCDRLGRGSRRDGTCPVGSYGSNAAGLSDMVGNLWEWTSDCLEGNCGRRVVRGGSWFLNAEVLRPGARSWGSSANRLFSRGFRVSRTLD